MKALRAIAFRAYMGPGPQMPVTEAILKGEPKVVILTLLVEHDGHHDGWEGTVLLPN